jgi:hypothetical protein
MGLYSTIMAPAPTHSTFFIASPRFRFAPASRVQYHYFL